MMILFFIQEMWAELSLHRLKTTLSLLGFIIGAALCVGLLSIGLNAQSFSMAQFSSLDTDLVHVELLKSQNQKLYIDSYSLAQRLKNTDPNIIAVSGLFHGSNKTSIQHKNLQALNLLSDAALYDFLKFTPKMGRVLIDMDSTQMFCMIGSALAAEIEAITHASPLHQTLSIGNHLFTIIGVLAPNDRGGFLFLNVNKTVFFNLAQLPRFSQQDITEWVLKLNDLHELDRTKKSITAFFNQIAPEVEVQVQSLDELIKKIEAQANLFMLLLLSIGFLSLICSGIGIMNVMLISIEGRKPEIGVRLTVGALPRDILRQFMKEAIFLTTAGAILGVALGEGLSFLLCQFFHWPYQLFASPSLLGILLSVITGGLFGFYPALKASRINPLFLLNAN